MADLIESDRVRLHNLERQNDEMKRTLEVNTTAIQELTDSTAALVKAWNTTSTVLSFVQFTAKIAAAFGALWLLFKGIPDWLQEIRKRD